MPDYKRSFVDGGTFFFTVISFNRQNIFTSPVFRAALRKSIQQARQQFPFEINVWVLLPDNLHSSGLYRLMIIIILFAGQ